MPVVILVILFFAVWIFSGDALLALLSMILCAFVIFPLLSLVLMKIVDLFDCCMDKDEDKDEDYL